MKYKINKKRGFTLIELLVVISIISLLSSIVLASLNESRERAAWNKFDQEILQIKNAIQLYRENNNGSWPPNIIQTDIDSSNDNHDGIDTLLSDLDEYISVDSIRDPNGNPVGMYYSEKSGNTNYFSCGDFQQDDGGFYSFYSLSQMSDSALFSTLQYKLNGGWSTYESYSCHSIK